MLRKFSAIVVFSLLLSLSLPATAGPASPAAPNSVTNIGTPLPLTCVGNQAPGPCVKGYVYYDGAPVSGATVTIDSQFGTMPITTTTGVLSNSPYFQAKLSGAPLLVSVGDTITLTASYNGSSASIVYAILPAGQQADIVIVASPLFGNGSDGDLAIIATAYTDNVRTALNATADADQTNLPVTSNGGFTIGDEILVIQMQGLQAGKYEFGTIVNISSGLLILNQNLIYTYTVDVTSRAQVLQVPQYHDLVVGSGGLLTAHSWDGSTGGIVALRANGSITVATGGSIKASGLGFNGGDRESIGPAPAYAQQGESIEGVGTRSTSPNGGGGGGALDNNGGYGAGGGGGGYGTAGLIGGSVTAGDVAGSGGQPYGQPNLLSLYVGPGGGGGEGVGTDHYGGLGGDGGGAILISGLNLNTTNGMIEANGEVGNTDGSSGGSLGSGGGGGGGGSILLKAYQLSLGANHVSSTGGNGGLTCCDSQAGGQGGTGRIRIESASLSGTTVPSASTLQITFPTEPISTIATVFPQVATQGPGAITFRGLAASPKLGGAAITSYVWRTDVEGILSPEASFTRTASSLHVGTYLIYFKARDSNNVWSEEISRTITIQSNSTPTPTRTATATPTSATPGAPSNLFLPSVIRSFGPFEAEPNNSLAQANGPLSSGLDYHGFQNDQNDYFSVFLAGPGNITVDLTNTSLPDTQLLLYFQTTSNLVRQAGGAPYHLNYSGAAGWYYVRVFTGTGTNNVTPYALRVTYP